MAVMLVRFYVKNYPTCAVLGSRFGLSRTRAHANFYPQRALVEGVLGDLGLMPARDFHTAALFQPSLAGAEVIRLEVTERDPQRPGDPDLQKEKYRGQKQRPTLPNTVIRNALQSIFSVGRTFPGPPHDYHLRTSEFAPGIAWFNPLEVYVDWGYPGIRKAYPPAELKIPHNRPRQSHKNPTPSWSEEENRYTPEVRNTRVGIEPALGGMTR